MKQAIITNWTFMRFLRLGIGIAILAQAVITKDILFVFFGLAFTAMPVFNVGCCGTGGCDVQPEKKVNSTKEIPYEEVV